MFTALTYVVFGIAIAVILHDAVYCGFLGKVLQNRLVCGKVDEVQDRLVSFLIARYNEGEIEAHFWNGDVIEFIDEHDKSVYVHVADNTLDEQFGWRVHTVQYPMQKYYRNALAKNGDSNLSYATKEDLYLLTLKMEAEYLDDY